MGKNRPAKGEIMKTLLCTIFMAITTCAMAQQNITLTWDPHPEAAQLLGFKLYQTKTPGAYTTTPVQTFTGGALTTGTTPKPGLGKWCWVLTAYVVDVESDNSNEVCTTLKPGKPNLKTAVLSALFTPIKEGPIRLAFAIAGKKRGLHIESIEEE